MKKGLNPEVLLELVKSFRLNAINFPFTILDDIIETELFSAIIDKKIKIKTFNFIFLFTYFWLHWVFVAVQGLSLVSAGRGYRLHCAALASHCGGLSRRRAWSPGRAGFRSYGSQPLKAQAH